MYYGESTFALRHVLHMNCNTPLVHKLITKRLFIRAGIVELVVTIARPEDSPQVRSSESPCACVVAAMVMACSRRGYVTPVALPTKAVGSSGDHAPMYVASTLPLIGKSDLFVRFVSGSSNICSERHWSNKGGQ